MLYEELAQIQFSKQQYISGMRALNINDYEHLTGDWHVNETWHEMSKLSPFHIMGKGKFCLIDTNLYLGEEGIFEATETLQEMGIPKFSSTVYAATHARAIADKVLIEAFLGNFFKQTKLFNGMTLFDFDNYMPSDEDKQRVYDLLEPSIALLPAEQASFVQIWLTAAKEMNSVNECEEQKIRTAWATAQAIVRQTCAPEEVESFIKRSNTRLERLIKRKTTIEQEESNLLKKWISLKNI